MGNSLFVEERSKGNKTEKILLLAIPIVSSYSNSVYICCINLGWVPGHKHIVGNKLADELTRGGSLPINLPTDETVKPPKSCQVSCFQNFSSKILEEDGT